MVKTKQMNNTKYKQHGRYKSKGHASNKNKRFGKGGRGVSSINPAHLISKESIQKEEKFIAQTKFNDFAMDQRLKNNLAKKGYSHPTEIQEKSFNDLIAGRNLIGVANTGTGKTGAFLLPIIHKLLTGNSFTSLVVVPTRELAQQVEEEFKSLAKNLNLYSICLIGGTSVSQDVRNLQRRNHLIVGTPGRLHDLAKRGALKFQNISVLVLDEFDRMLDMGFVEEIKKIVQLMKNREQTMLFSATIENKQRSLISELVDDPIEIKVSSGSKASSSVEQKIIRVDRGSDKLAMLVDLINEKSFSKVIVFAETKRSVDSLSKKLLRSGISTGLIHGGKSQGFRNKSISFFKKGKTRVLVATDVAARGLDIDNVSHVINYQLPMTMDSYIHRIGRTGRAGNKGMAYTFVD